MPKRSGSFHLIRASRIFHCVLQRFQLMMQIPDAPAPRDRLIEHTPPLHLLNILPEIPDGELLGNRDVAIVRRFFAHDHAEERSLARAIRTDQSGLLTGIQLKGSFYENELLTILLADVGKRDHYSLG